MKVSFSQFSGNIDSVSLPLNENSLINDLLPPEDIVRIMTFLDPQPLILVSKDWNCFAIEAAQQQEFARIERLVDSVLSLIPKNESQSSATNNSNPLRDQILDLKKSASSFFEKENLNLLKSSVDDLNNNFPKVIKKLPLDVLVDLEKDIGYDKIFTLAWIEIIKDVNTLPDEASKKTVYSKIVNKLIETGVMNSCNVEELINKEEIVSILFECLSSKEMNYNNLKGALSIVLEIPDDETRIENLIDLSDEFIDNNRLKEALSIKPFLEKEGDDEGIARLLSKITLKMLKDDKIDEALDVCLEIPVYHEDMVEDYQTVTFYEVFKALMLSTNVKDHQKKALAVAKLITDSSWRFQCIQAVIDEYVCVDNIVGALEIIHSLPEVNKYFSLQALLEELKRRGNFEKAKLVEGILFVFDKEYFSLPEELIEDCINPLCLDAEYQKVESTPLGISVCPLSKESYKSQKQSGVKGLIKRVDFERNSKKFIDSVTGDGIVEKHKKSLFLHEICRNLLQKGSHKIACALADRILEVSIKVSVYRNIIQYLIQVGKIEKATKIANSMYDEPLNYTQRNICKQL